MTTEGPITLDAETARRCQADAYLVGLGRSGSNSLREFMDAHEAISWRRDLRILLRGDGTAYPAQAAPFATAACKIDVFEWYALGVFRYGLLDGEWDEVRYQLPGRVSSPGFRVDPEAACQRLGVVSPDARIVILLREQVDWLAACYRAQAANLPPHRSRFRDYLRCTEGLIHLEAAHYDRLLELYRSRFGGQRVHVILSEALRQAPDAALEGLCAFLGVPPFHGRLPLRQNAGPPPALVRLHRVLAAIPGERPLARWLGGWVRRRPGGWSAWPRLRELDATPPLSAAEAERLRAAFREGNRRVASICGLDLAAYGYAT